MCVSSNTVLTACWKCEAAEVPARTSPRRVSDFLCEEPRWRGFGGACHDQPYRISQGKSGSLSGFGGAPPPAPPGPYTGAGRAGGRVGEGEAGESRSVQSSLVNQNVP